ncbi:hypothetical protein D3C87_1853120 [compost metagenome]
MHGAHTTKGNRGPAQVPGWECQFECNVYSCKHTDHTPENGCNTKHFHGLVIVVEFFYLHAGSVLYYIFVIHIG